MCVCVCEREREREREREDQRKLNFLSFWSVFPESLAPEGIKLFFTSLSDCCEFVKTVRQQFLVGHIFDLIIEQSQSFLLTSFRTMFTENQTLDSSRLQTLIVGEDLAHVDHSALIDIFNSKNKNSRHFCAGFVFGHLLSVAAKQNILCLFRLILLENFQLPGMRESVRN